MKILRDPSIALIVAILAIVVSIVLIEITKPYKGLRVETLSNTPLISVNADIVNEIQVLFRGKPVQALSLILLRFENTGNEPIKEDDYSEPIRISISENAEIGEISVQETRPDGIPLTSTVTTGNQIELSKVLFNPGDQAILKILVLNNDGTLKIGGRIAGIREIEIQSVLEGSNVAQSSIPPHISALILFGTVGIVVGGILISESRRFIEWRKRRFGYDPARAYYIAAQEYMLKSDISQTISFLRKAFSWESSYVEKSQKDTVFSSIQGYERYKALIDKYKRP